jgi:hypothetical protein
MTTLEQLVKRFADNIDRYNIRTDNAKPKTNT